MKTSLLLIFALLGAIPPFSVLAQSQREMNQEARKDFEKADAELDRVCKTVIAKLPDKEAVELMRKAQRAWVAFRDADSISCSDEMRGGSAAPLLLYGNKARLTKERIRQLRARFELGKGEPQKKQGASANLTPILLCARVAPAPSTRKAGADERGIRLHSMVHGFKVNRRR